jgi:hypothetical protein
LSKPLSFVCQIFEIFIFEVTDEGIDILTWRNFSSALVIRTSVVAPSVSLTFMLVMLVIGWNVRVHLATSILSSSLGVGRGVGNTGATRGGSGVLRMSLENLVGGRE